MKVLAVIPARAGSKGIPNKNIRMLMGKPLVSYCIENALKSKFITDIVVTTDSEEVKLIAKRYGVIIRNREKALCEDNVTLDCVIYDASKQYDVDFVVTLQPTSPTLQYKTLDKAIEYVVRKDVDTLISVVNKPQLAWVEKGGQIVPDYEKRLNRQYLPKRFLETGAFVITKAEFVTENSRIGRQVDVFEISESEAVDIDDFQDFLYAEQILKRKNIAIVVNGNKRIGMGHIYRMLEIADQFYVKPIFFYNDAITKKEDFGNTTYTLEKFSTYEELFIKLKEKDIQLIINDVLDTDAEYMAGLRQCVSKIINFEDEGSGGIFADAVINALYDCRQECKNIYLGEEYYYLPKLFLLYSPINIKESVKKIFVCFGGADPKKYTELVLEEFTKSIYSEYQFTIVLGRAKDGLNEIRENYKNKNIQILYDVKNIPELMSVCDVAVTSMGRTCYELAYLGIPTVAIAQNEREERHAFVCEKNGFHCLKMNSLNTDIISSINYLIESDRQYRKDIQDKLLSFDLKKGREKVRDIIKTFGEI